MRNHLTALPSLTAHFISEKLNRHAVAESLMVAVVDVSSCQGLIFWLTRILTAGRRVGDRVGWEISYMALSKIDNFQNTCHQW